MSSTASHTPGADLCEGRSGAAPPTAETPAPILGRGAETAAAAFIVPQLHVCGHGLQTGDASDC